MTAKLRPERRGAWSYIGSLRGISRTYRVKAPSYLPTHSLGIHCAHHAPPPPCERNLHVPSDGTKLLVVQNVAKYDPTAWAENVVTLGFHVQQLTFLIFSFYFCHNESIYVSRKGTLSYPLYFPTCIPGGLRAFIFDPPPPLNIHNIGLK